MGATTLSTTFVSSTKLTATGSVTSQTPSVQFTVTNPDPGSATSGTLTAKWCRRYRRMWPIGSSSRRLSVRLPLGRSGAAKRSASFLTNQFAMPAMPYADPATTETSLGPLQQRFFVQTLTAQDQLRQRVAFALSQIFVIAGDKISDPRFHHIFASRKRCIHQLPPNHEGRDALSCHGPLPRHGEQRQARTGQHANENYARELMQLFTVGTALLNEDGSLQLDSSNNPIPTYTQDQVQASPAPIPVGRIRRYPARRSRNTTHPTGPAPWSQRIQTTTHFQAVAPVYHAASGGLLPPAKQLRRISTARSTTSSITRIFRRSFRAS